MMVYQDGEKWYEHTYKYGVGHGISRNYTRGGKLLTEMEVKDGKEVKFRNFKEDGLPDR